MSLIAELKRRNVFRVAAAYVVLSWLLLQVGDVLFEALDVPEWGLRLLVGLLILGLLPALVFSWAYEITPEGIKRESEVDRSTSITPHTGRKLDLITIALVVAGVGFALIDRLVLERPGSAPVPVVVVEDNTAGPATSPGPSPVGLPVDERKSVAVLPFSSFSDDPENAYFASGVHEDILTHLARIHELRVISRSSVEQYAENRPTVAEIAQALSVDHILEGSVRRAGDRVRVSAQLIDARTDEHLWADNFDRTLDDVFAIQTEIARRIAAALEATLSPVEESLIAERPTTNMEAYDLYLRGREILRRGEYAQDKYIEAEPLLKRAVELDPDFALAWALLAQIHGQGYWIGFGDLEERKLAMKQAVDRTVALAPNRPESLAIQGEYHYRIESDYPRAVEMLEKALELAPGDIGILGQLGMALRRVGRWEESVDRFAEAVSLDPVNLNAVQELASTLLMLRRWDAVIAAVDAVLKEHPDATGLAALKGWALKSGYGRVDEAARVIAGRPASTDFYYALLKINLRQVDRDLDGVLAVMKSPALKPFFATEFWKPYEAYIRAEIAHLGGDEEQARSLWTQVRSKGRELFDRTPQSGFGLAVTALAEVRLGNREIALASAERAVEIARKSQDHVDEPGVRMIRAEVLGRAGEHDAALDELADLLNLPNGPSPWDLALDSNWDFIRDHPRFSELARVEATLGVDDGGG